MLPSKTATSPPPPPKSPYVPAPPQETRSAPEPSTPADTIFFGGGTPSLLEPAEIARLIEACRGLFDISSDCETPLEANPETVTEARLAAYRCAGVNRVSFGVQSFREIELRRLSRLHT